MPRRFIKTRKEITMGCDRVRRKIGDERTKKEERRMKNEAEEAVQEEMEEDKRAGEGCTPNIESFL